MAPELALEALSRVGPNAIVLDPMCGSGTVLKHAIEDGHRAIGFDLDPLAVLVSRVACRRLTQTRVMAAAEEVLDRARAFRQPPELPWIDSDDETRQFIDFWFAPTQRDQLRRLAAVLSDRSGQIADLLRLSLSRTIITKDRGASRARDVSHSRPHRTRMVNDYDVFDWFRQAAAHISSTADRPISGTATIRVGDARRLPESLRQSVDLVVTSPPYLNAIDYMRGHRLALVWLGYRLGDLRRLRSESVGAERMPEREWGEVRRLVPRHRNLSDRRQGMLDRYAADIDLFMSEVAKVLRPAGEAVLVVGDCNIQGVYIRNSAIVQKAGERSGLQVLDRKSRRLPTTSRYLPPPSRAAGDMSKRIRSEIVLRFQAVGSII